MTTRRRIVEWGKNILIVLLACSAVTLAVMASADDVSGGTTLLGRLTSWLSTGETPDTARADAHVQAAALPVAVSVQSQAGRYSALYDAAALSDAYARFGGLLGQALESAGSAQPSAMSAVREALTQQSVYFAYPGAVPLAALAGWLDGMDPDERERFTDELFDVLQAGGASRLDEILASAQSIQKVLTALTAADQRTKDLVRELLGATISANVESNPPDNPTTADLQPMCFRRVASPVA